MIFEEVVLHNFGAYRGQHRISLEVNDSQPVVVIGAMNGSGKTTLLDAMQLALYGKAAKCSGRDKISYPDYLEAMINRDAPPQQGAGVDFTFRSRINGQDSRIKVSRTWQKRGESVKENLEVYRDDQLDSVASERWSEFVEDFMPSQIADLFFFDGEKIEALADPQRSAELLKAGIHSLLGIDLVESLMRSLQQMERKRRVSELSEIDRAKLDELDNQRNELEQGLKVAIEKRGTHKTELDAVISGELKQTEHFKKIGGDLFNKKEELLMSHKRLTTQKNQLENELRELAAGILPLNIPMKLLNSVVEKAQSYRRGGDLDLLRNEAEQRDTEIVRFLSSLSVDGSTISKLNDHLHHDRLARYQAQEAAFLPPELLEQYNQNDVRVEVNSAKRVLAELADTKEHLNSVERNLAAVPFQENLAEVQAKIEDYRAQRAKLEAILTLLNEDIESISSKLERTKQQFDAEAEKLGEQLMAEEQSRRVISHSARARKTLEKFRERLLQENLHRLEKTILECFQHLIRKNRLVHDISIDPQTFLVSVLHSSGQVVPAHRLSAGERQLLAVATLWALAHSSGRKLPAVIDTPLSRLDSKHRGTLVKNYFPMASHQVILLSTDEEVVGRYHTMLKPHIGREYLIEHDETKASSSFVEGYFSDQPVLEAA